MMDCGESSSRGSAPTAVAMDAAAASSDKRSGGEVPLDRFHVGNGAASDLPVDAGSFDGHSRRTSLPASAAADAAAVVARAATARAGEVTMPATLPALLS